MWLPICPIIPGKNTVPFADMLHHVQYYLPVTNSALLFFELVCCNWLLILSPVRSGLWLNPNSQFGLKSVEYLLPGSHCSRLRSGTFACNCFRTIDDTVTSCIRRSCLFKRTSLVHIQHKDCLGLLRCSHGEPGSSIFLNRACMGSAQTQCLSEGSRGPVITAVSRLAAGEDSAAVRPFVFSLFQICFSVIYTDFYLISQITTPQCINF